MTNAATPRETADHAEMVRLAEAATARLAGPNLNADGFGLQIWGDSLKGGSTHILDVRGWGYLTGGGHGALGLSEDDGIAAQRAIQAYAVAAWNAVPALLSEIAALRGDLTETRVAADLLVSSVRADLRQAERQRDEAVGLLRELWQSVYYDTQRSPAAPITLGTIQKADAARAFLANQGADQ